MRKPVHRRTLVEQGGSWTPTMFDCGIRVNLPDYAHASVRELRGLQAERLRSGDVNIVGSLSKDTIPHFVNWLMHNYDNLG